MGHGSVDRCPYCPTRFLLALVTLGDRLAPDRDEVVVRTGPDFDDQGREVVAALLRAGTGPVTLLVDRTDPGPAAPVGAAVVPIRSLAGVRAFWRARVVVHSHGVFGARAMSRRKVFVNIWHGMPIKRLEAGSDVGRNQTSFTVATAPVHADHLATTWSIPRDRVAIHRPPAQRCAGPGGKQAPRPDALRPAVAGDRPLLVAAPPSATTSPFHGGGAVRRRRCRHGQPVRRGDTRGRQCADARLGLHAIIKPHPLAPAPDRASFSNLEVSSDADLSQARLTLYRLLAHADIVITDHSSVWVDYLLVQRPMVFAVSDPHRVLRDPWVLLPVAADLLPGR